MKPVIVQSLIKHNKKKKDTTDTPDPQPIKHEYGGTKDRSGVMVIIMFIIAIGIALALT